MKRRLSALLAALALLMTMTACGSEEERGTPTGTTVDRSKTTTAPVVTQPTTAPTQAPVVVDPVPTGTLNIITGKYDMGDTALTRPVAIMVANNDFLQDGEQVGVGSADMWMETETEGGITRLMAVFANTARVPASIGPVRSARSPFFHVVKALGLAYVHAGGSYPALNKIAASNIADMDVNAGDYGGNYSWRDNDYGHAYEYRLRTSGDRLTTYMNDRGYNTSAVCDFPWTFGEQSGVSATDISIKMSGAQRIGFEYDAAQGVYYKTNGSSKLRHIDSSGNAIAPTSVIVLYTDMFYESNDTIDYYMQSGKGYVFSAGVMRRFDWTRDNDGFVMNEEDGTKLTLAEGKVYLCVASTSYADSLSYQ